MKKDKCQFESCWDTAIFTHIWVNKGGWVESLKLCQNHTSGIYDSSFEEMVDKSYQIFDISHVEESYKCRKELQEDADTISTYLKQVKKNKRRDLINKKLKHQEQVDLVL